MIGDMLDSALRRVFGDSSPGLSGPVPIPHLIETEPVEVSFTLSEQLARAAARRARVADWLESRACGYEMDAEHAEQPRRPGTIVVDSALTPMQQRAIAGELRSCARDITRRPA